MQHKKADGAQAKELKMFTTRPGMISNLANSHGKGMSPAITAFKPQLPPI